MPRLAKSSKGDRRRPQHLASAKKRHAAVGTTRMDPAVLMPAGSGLTIPHLERVPLEYQFRNGDQALAVLAKTLLNADIAAAADWERSGRNPIHFLEHTLAGWLKQHSPIEEFHLKLLLSNAFDEFAVTRYDEQDGESAAKMFLLVEPDMAGYVVFGPTLRLFERIHPQLPVTFFHLFLGSLCQWVRVYDYRDATDRAERLREWYEQDPDDSIVELPDIWKAVPKCLKRKPLSTRTLRAMLPGMRNAQARSLLELAMDVYQKSRTTTPPEIDESLREVFLDHGDPLPALLAVFEAHDEIEGQFDEEAQGMLETPPEPNLIIPFNGEDTESAAGAFFALNTLCETLACASKLIQLMPGNSPAREG